MAFDAYLKLPDLEGESITKGAEGWIKLYSFSFGASNPASVATGGMAAGKPSVSSFTVMKETDTCSPELFQHLMLGQHWDTGEVQLIKSSGTDEGLVFLKFDFKELFPSNISWSGGSGGDSRPMESVSFDFSAIKVEYKAQTEKGGAGNNLIGSYNLRTSSKDF